MIKRTVEVSREAVHIAVRDEQLLILRKREDEVPSRLPAHPPNLVGSVPCEDLGVLMVDSRETTYSHHALAKLAEHGAALVVCGRDHHPAGMYLPLSTNTQLLSRLDAQLTASRPVRKRIWQQLVQAKIRAQGSVLGSVGGQTSRAACARVLSLANRVRSGDPDNVEAQAAAVYWPALFRDCLDVPQPFRRRPGDLSAPPPNNLLDYGYAALRAATARAIVSAGLLPALGIQHRGRSNPFCLADDLMEPLRPLIDWRALQLARRGELSLAQSNKAELLRVLTLEVSDGNLRGPLQVMLSRFVSDFVRVLTRECDSIRAPTAVAIEGPES